MRKDDREDGEMKWWGRALNGEYVGEKKRKRIERQKRKESLLTPGYGAFH